MARLSLEGVRKTFGRLDIIKGIDLDVRDGEFVVFVGPSGCGKSTLLRLIAGLDHVTSGAIGIEGRDVSGLPPAERGIAMVFQSYALYPHMSVAANLAFGLENLRLPKAEIGARVAEAARMLVIHDLLDRRPKDLSGGQRQRVAIGRAIVRDPKIFLFDEPLSNLDAALRVQTRAEISALHKRLGATMIYVTHDQIEAMTMADRIAVLNDGRLEQFGAPLDLFENPVNRFVAGFIGSPSMNVYDGRLAASGAPSVEVPGFPPLGDLFDTGSLGADEILQLGLRPNDFLLGDAGHGGVPVRLVVDRSECIGTETYIYGRIAGNETPTVALLPGLVSVRDGEVLPLLFHPRRCHLFRKSDGIALPKRPAPEAGAGR